MSPPPPPRRNRAEERPRPSTPQLVLAGRAFVGGRLQPIEIGIDAEGVIVAIAKHVEGDTRRELGDAVILPSATDLHVHFRDPGGPGAMESLATGTEQAAIGGVGLVGDMPNTEPPISTPDQVLEKVGRARGRVATDLLVYSHLPVRSSSLPIARVAGALKLYLSPTTGVDDPPARSEIGALLEAAAASRLALTVHAEDPRTFIPMVAMHDPVDWDHHRPASSELGAVRSLLPTPPALRLMVAHVTTSAVVRTLRTAGQAFEVTPHHLLLSARRTEDARFKVNPPLRSEVERAKLWAEFQQGRVPCLASDHAPHSAEEKCRPFAEAPSGVPGVETMLPLLLDQVRDGGLALPTLIAAACDRPARWAGVPRGRLCIGHRADLLVVDFRTRTKIADRHLHAPCGWSVFAGWEGIFPREHYLNGERIVEAGEYVGRPIGEIVRPEFALGGTGRALPAVEP